MRKRPLPTGTVTFLFTDIEGSTALWERDDAAMRLALAKHDMLIRRAVEADGGCVFKTVGDAAHCAFSRPEDAIAAAATAQRSIARARWPERIGRLPVRMAIHTGTAQLRDRDYFGPTLNRAARLLALACGAQILLSEATAILVEDRLLDRCELRDLGSHALRGLRSRERAYQLLAPGLRADFPPIVSMGTSPNNLPALVSSFVGRRDDLGNILALVREHRLVTIAGPGGMGKTRVAIEAARRAVEAFPDGVFFVTFAPLEPHAGVDAVAAGVARSLGIREAPGETLVDALAREIGHRKLLLVADNVEHVLAASGNLIKGLAERCPNVSIVATTREPLHANGEFVYRLPPMPPSRATTLAGLRDSDACLLFMTRASASGATFRDEDASDVAAICRRLDGIPLALELAAAHAGAFGIHNLLARIDAPLRLLVSKDASEDTRHRTLEATIDWSYRLLDETVRATLQAIATFSGGFSLDAARVVAGSHAADPLAFEATVEDLVDKSLILPPAGGDGRFTVLETIRSFAIGRAEDDGRLLGFRNRHFDYFARLAARRRDQSPDLKAWLNIYATDKHNFDAALSWAVRGGLQDAIRLACDLAFAWQIRGDTSFGVRSLEEILNTSAFERTRDLAEAYRRASTLATMGDRYELATTYARVALTIYEELGDGLGAAEARFNTAVVAQREGRDRDAATIYRQCLAAFLEQDHDRGALVTASNLAQLAMKSGDLSGAGTYLADADLRSNRVGDPNIRASVLTTAAVLSRRIGDLDNSERLLNTVLRECEALGNEEAHIDALAVMTTVLLDRGKHREAEETAHLALERARELESPALTALCFERLADVMERTGRDYEAAVRLGAASKLRADCHFSYDGDNAAEELSRKLARALGTSAFRDAITEGAAGVG